MVDGLFPGGVSTAPQSGAGQEEAGPKSSSAAASNAASMAPASWESEPALASALRRLLSSACPKEPDTPSGRPTHAMNPRATTASARAPNHHGQNDVRNMLMVLQ